MLAGSFRLSLFLFAALLIVYPQQTRGGSDYPATYRIDFDWSAPYDQLGIDPYKHCHQFQVDTWDDCKRLCERSLACRSIDYNYHARYKFCYMKYRAVEESDLVSKNTIQHANLNIEKSSNFDRDWFVSALCIPGDQVDQTFERTALFEDCMDRCILNRNCLAFDHDSELSVCRISYSYRKTEKIDNEETCNVRSGNPTGCRSTAVYLPRIGHSCCCDRKKDDSGNEEYVRECRYMMCDALRAKIGEDKIHPSNACQEDLCGSEPWREWSECGCKNQNRIRTRSNPCVYHGGEEKEEEECYCNVSCCCWTDKSQKVCKYMSCDAITSRSPRRWVPTGENWQLPCSANPVQCNNRWSAWGACGVDNSAWLTNSKCSKPGQTTIRQRSRDNWCNHPYVRGEIEYDQESCVCPA